ncbi:MAG: substrate-binding and VWA domain-containing protein [Acidimicrobiales bacterium]
MRTTRRLALAITLALLVTACTSGNDDDGAPDDTAGLGDPGDCIVVDLALSPEKIDLMTELAGEFNDTGVEVGGRCVFARPQRKSSGVAATALIQGWDEEVDGPRPVVWSPAASTWGQVVNQRLTANGRAAIATEAEPFMLTPLVIAMPEPMARALGWPGTPIGWADVLDLARSQQGWGEFGHPEWGQFKLGKTNPNFSTSGLAALIAQTYAATGKTTGLSAEDLASPSVIDFATGVESAVVHYGDTTLTFLNNWYRADQRGTALTYVSAAAVEEKSVIDYNTGNPDGVLDPGEDPEAPRTPLVAIYPKEGTLFSDNPYIVLDAEWVDEDETEAARLFEEFIKEPDNQRRVLEFGFRPGNPSVAIADPISAESGVDPDQPQTLLDVPEPEVMVELLERWDQQRKRARVLLVLDVSGSMGAPADEQDENGPTRLDLAKEAAIDALDLFADDDEVALRIFSTDLAGPESDEYIDLVDYGRVGDQAEALRNTIDDLIPTNGTPLYGVAEESYQKASENYDPTRINAVVLLTDGENDDGNQGDDESQLTNLLGTLRSGSEGQATHQVRVFTISYGGEADLDILRRLAEASTAAAYNASNPATINQVLSQVISNF